MQTNPTSINFNNLQPENIGNYLSKLFSMAQLNEEQQNILLQGVLQGLQGLEEVNAENIPENNQPQEEINEPQEENQERGQEGEQEDNYIKNLADKLQHIWGDNSNKNSILAFRGLDWLGFNLNDDHSYNSDEIDFLNKMVSLGYLLSEDKKFSHGKDNFHISKQEAIKQRNNLALDKSFMEALYNKSSLSHKSALDKLNQLNSIISKK